MGASPAPAGRLRPRDGEALGSGHGGGPARLDAGANTAVPRRRVRMLRVRAVDDRLRLAGLHGGGGLRTDDARRIGLHAGTPPRRARGRARRQRGAVLAAGREGEAGMKQTGRLVVLAAMVVSL